MATEYTRVMLWDSVYVHTHRTLMHAFYTALSKNRTPQVSTRAMVHMLP